MSGIPLAGAAVLVIDIQVGLFCTERPPDESAEVIARVNEVTNKARAARVPIFFVQNDGPRDGDWLVPHTEDWQLHPDLERRPKEVIIRKTTGDAFYGTGLEQTLRDAGIQSLVLMGYATDFCIDATLRNAVSKDFEVYVVSDGHTTDDALMLKASVLRQYFNWVWGDSPSARGIHLCTAAEIEFRQGAVDIKTPKQ